MAVPVLCSQLCTGQRDLPFGMPMQLPVIRRGDALDPMVVDEGIDVADVKGIIAQLHFGPNDPRRGQHVIPVQQIVELNAVIAVDQRGFSWRTGKGRDPKGIIILNTSVFSLSTEIQPTLPCLSWALS